MSYVPTAAPGTESRAPHRILARESKAALAFVERNFYLTKRYWGWEAAFLVYTGASSLSIMFIGASQDGDTNRLILFLAIGTLVWGYLNSVFMNVAETVAWERWEGTIEYTMMAPVSRVTHMFGMSLFAILYGLIRSTVLFLILVAFFPEISLSQANLGGAALVIAVGSFSFIGFGIVGAVLPLLFPEKGEQMTFIISSILLLVSGVYYPISVLPGWMQWFSNISPATYVLEAMRSAILDGAPVADLFGDLAALGLIAVVSIPAGMAIFGYFERYAKRTGRLKRSG
ncbi:MAG: ABC transporter permease [Thermomicrobiales bacterium]